MRTIKFRAWNHDHFIFLELTKVGCKYSDAFDEPQHDVEWQQFTGLQDRNGKDIYESDIVTIYVGTLKTANVSVEFSNGSFGMRLKGEFYDFYSAIELGMASFEVIGNVHQNPELLKDR